MEKFHKYCLGVLLVIICTNVSSQFNVEITKNLQFRSICEFHEDEVLLDDLLVNEANKLSPFKRLSFREKASAIDLFGGNSFQKSIFNCVENAELYELRSCFLVHDNQLNNANVFDEFSYFKIKNSKVRNKDYLDKVA